MANRFKDKTMRQTYDACVNGWETKHGNFFLDNGQRCMGNAWAVYFWKGFDGVKIPSTGFEKVLGYACWRAGQDCAKVNKTTTTTTAKKRITVKDLNLYLNNRKAEISSNLARGMHSKKPTDYLLGQLVEISATLDFINKKEQL